MNVCRSKLPLKTNFKLRRWVKYYFGTSATVVHFTGNDEVMNSWSQGGAKTGKDWQSRIMKYHNLKTLE